MSRSLIEHEVLADESARVGKPVRSAAVCGVEQQSRGFGAVRTQHHDARLLRLLESLAVEVAHSGRTAARIAVDPKDVALRANLATPGRLRLRDHGVETR